MINLNEKAEDRVIRVFVSSTFRDMREERDYLAKKVFPRIRAFCKERGIEFLELDLRWGITEKESQSSKVIELCLREIKKCKPYFIGILGERYGWIPERAELDKNPGIISEFKEVEGYIDDGMSVTEIEIQNGALRIPEMRDKAFFCFRIMSSTPEEFREQPESNRYRKLERLKEKIQLYSAGKPVQFSTCQELGEQVYSHFTAASSG